MKGYFFRNYVFATLAMMLFFIAVGASFIAIGRNLTMSERENMIEKSAEEVADVVSAYSAETEINDLRVRVVLSTISEVTDFHCFVTDADGIVIACSDRRMDCEHIGADLSESFFSGFTTEDSCWSKLSSLNGFYSKIHYITAVPVTDSDGLVIGYAFSSSDVESLVRSWHILMYCFLAFCVLIMSASGLIGFLNYRRQAKPVNEMAAAAMRFAHGDFSARVTAEGEDEIAALGNAFNQMAESLAESETRRSEFLANVAHELKTPMTSISGFADGILDGTIPRERERQYLETISSETKRLNRLVRRLLDMSKLQAMPREELLSHSFDAGELLVETMLVFEKKIEDKKLEVDLQIPENRIEVRGDSDSINQVIYNLLENAIKFSPVGAPLCVSLFRQEDKAYISVKNHGDTIPPDELGRIFDRFHKTDKSRSVDRDGVGLGLYIVKSILNNHGEDIAVTSHDGVTEFVFSLTLKS